MYYPKSCLILPALVVLAPALQANDFLRSSTTITNDSTAVWRLEPGAVAARFTVAVLSENGPLVSTSETVSARTSYRIQPGQTVLLRLQDASRSVKATFQLRDQRKQVSPLPCLSYRFKSSSRGWFASCFPCCCSEADPGQASLGVTGLEAEPAAAGCLESASPDRIRITGNQWPEFPKLPDLLSELATTRTPL